MSDRRSEIESLFERALDLPAPERAEWLERTCADAGLRSEVLKLLAAHDRAGILERPLASVAADVEATLASEPGSGETPTGYVGSYEILEEIGRGGMGIVMKARDERLDRLVAMKFLSPDAAATPERRARFAAEARAASLLDHRAVARVYDVGETDDGHLYLVMAYCAGRTLDRFIADGPFDIETARSIALGVAEGLASAHRAGIIHRDIKPSNIMVSPDGSPRILDFGIAKVADAPAMTRTGMRLGTVAYMSPEQARGERVDPRADLWSLGVVLYEMLTGVRPFRGRTPAAIVHEILTADPAPPSTVRAGVPEALDRIVGRALARARDERYRDVPAFITDLDPSRDTPSNARSRHAELTPNTRVVLRRLAIFAGSFSLADAEVVADGVEPSDLDVLEALDELLAEGFMTRAETADGASRFRVSERTRDLALEELDRHDETAMTRARLATLDSGNDR